MLFSALQDWEFSQQSAARGLLEDFVSDDPNNENLLGKGEERLKYCCYPYGKEESWKWASLEDGASPPEYTELYNRGQSKQHPAKSICKCR